MRGLLLPLCVAFIYEKYLSDNSTTIVMMIVTSCNTAMTASYYPGLYTT
jgi:hypothetical protein